MLNAAKSNWKLNHVGQAVGDLDAAIAFQRDVFGFELDSREKLPAHGVEVAFMKLENTMIELLQPLAGSESKLGKFLERNGPGLHHLCYEVADISAELQRLKAAGIKLIDEAPRPGAHNTLIAFLHPQSTQGVLVELCSKKCS